MATGIRYDLADPESDPGWDYDTPGGVQRGHPSIAIWTWARKGMFPPTTQVTETNTEAWRSLTAAAPDITVRARAQFARELFLNSEDMQWYYLSADGAIDNMSYSGPDMIYYLGNGQLPGEIQLCGVAGQRGAPPRSQFKKFSQVLEQFMGERVPLPRPVTPRSEGGENGNSLMGNSIVHSNGNAPAPVQEKKPIPGFADLQMMHRDALFGDPNMEWYTWFDNSASGPFPGNMMRDLSADGSLPNTYPLRAVATDSAPPQESEFKPLEDLLLELHLAKGS
ncbi:hypothetical protein BSKO_02045 [Bryopsis sp. KO-2023]|nr:hypothetical protein BSKO_02045 [Bryopsis sp. KO-2023]